MLKPIPNDQSIVPQNADMTHNSDEIQIPVVTQQPTPTAYLYPPPPRLWTTGLFDICSDVRICVCSFFCFRFYGCRVAKDMDEHMCVPCCVPMWLLALRTKMRVKQNIAGSVMHDCCVVVCCPSCALCQLAREFKHVHPAKIV